MYTQCPHCQTCFRIAEDHLKIANGKVRCGSCQEVFDATRYLFKNLTDREPVTFNPAPAPRQTPPAQTRQTPRPVSGKNDTTDQDRSNSPSPRAVEKILQERKKVPDQTVFMESTLGSDRYNNLDQMGPIDIPGQIDLDDSIIEIDEDDDKPVASKAPPTPESRAGQADHKPGVTPASAPPKTDHPNKTPDAPRTVYEDIESKDAPATEEDQETLENFFAEVDAQLGENEDGKSQLDKDIDELLAFAKGIDSVTPPSPANETSTPDIDIGAPPDTQGIELSEDYDMQAINDFEKELEASNPDMFRQVSEHEDAEQQETTAAADPAGHGGTTADAAPAEPPVSPPDESNAQAEPALTTEEATPAPAEHEEDIPRALRQSLQMLNDAPRRSLGKSLLMLLLIMLLLGGLGFQAVLFRNVELAHQFPTLAPTLSKICARLPCRYSGKVDVSQIKLLNRDVRSDPNQPNALLISATFVDKAPFDQPYPIIKITLYDLGGNVVASRRFTPKEYLQKMYNRFLLMESGTPVRITLAVLDPGKDAINFEFTFL